MYVLSFVVIGKISYQNMICVCAVADLYFFRGGDYFENWARSATFEARQRPRKAAGHLGTKKRG